MLTVFLHVGKNDPITRGLRPYIMVGLSDDGRVGKNDPITRGLRLDFDVALIAAISMSERMTRLRGD